MKSGRNYIRNSPESPKKRVLKKLLPPLEILPLWKKRMKSAIKLCMKISKPVVFLKETVKLSGNAVTVDIFTKVKKPLMCVRLVYILSHILRLKRPIIKIILSADLI
jgi:hypothetical protein